MMAENEKITISIFKAVNDKQRQTLRQSMRRNLNHTRTHAQTMQVKKNKHNMAIKSESTEWMTATEAICVSDDK